MSLPMSLRAPIRKSRVASDSVARDRSRRVHGIQSVRKLVDVDQVGNLSDEYENTGLFYPDADEDTHDDFEAVVDIQGVVNREARAEIPDFGADMNRVMEVDPTKEPYGQADSAGELRADADTRANVDAEADEHPNSNTREFDRTYFHAQPLLSLGIRSDARTDGETETRAKEMGSSDVDDRPDHQECVRISGATGDERDCSEPELCRDIPVKSTINARNIYSGDSGTPHPPLQSLETCRSPIRTPRARLQTQPLLEEVASGSADAEKQVRQTVSLQNVRPSIAPFSLHQVLSESREALMHRGLHRRGRAGCIIPAVTLQTSSSREITRADNSTVRSFGGHRERRHGNRRRSSSDAIAAALNSAEDSDECEEDEGEAETTLQECWYENLRLIMPGFCDPNNEAASLRGARERLTPGEIAYSGLIISHENNEDLLFIYRHKYEAKAIRGQAVTSYDQLRSCAGQYMRFAIVCGLTTLPRACDSGELFRAVLSMDAVQTFLTYFQLRCSASTVLIKAIHLRTLSQYAERFYSTVSVDDSCRAKASLVSDYLTGACSAEKYESRRGTARMRSEELRIAAGRLIAGDDFRRFGEEAEKSLASIMNGGVGNVRRNSRVRARWCISLVGLLVFYGGGQRPQAYAQLQEPDDLEGSLRRWAQDRRVTLATQLEKRPRQTGYSKISFPGRTLKIFEFHLRVVKPAIREAVTVVQTETERRAAWQRERGEDVDNPILLDTRTGEGYVPGQIRSTLQCYVRNFDPELGETITPSSVRSSYATWKFQAYKRGQIFTGMSESDFLDTLAKIMNTSAEQLQATYIACRQMDSHYDRIISEVHSMFEQEEPREASDTAIDEPDRISEPAIAHQVRH
jgi:hypothetical protein